MSEPSGETAAQAGVMATRPATTPEAAPSEVGVAVADLLHEQPAEHRRAGGGGGVDPDAGGLRAVAPRARSPR